MKPGDKVGRYELERLLGEGAMSCVFAARDPQLERSVALKLLRREVSHDRQYVGRFLEDARMAATLEHPNIVGVRHFDTAEGTPFIVMELVDGQSLDRLLAERRQLDVSEAARIAREVALALGVAHASGITHRDVKPSNILIDRRTGGVKLTDFGAAKRERPRDQTLTTVGQVIGTPLYMAPEQVNGEAVDARTDLWSLGATLYEMLAGRRPFDANNEAKLYHAIVHEAPPRLATLRSGLPPGLTGLTERLLAKSPSARPASADDVAKTLTPFAQPAPAAPEPPTSRPRVPGWSSSFTGRPALIGGGVAAVVIVAGLAAILWPERAAEPPGPDGSPGSPTAETSPPPTLPEALETELREEETSPPPVSAEVLETQPPAVGTPPPSASSEVTEPEALPEPQPPPAAPPQATQLSEQAEPEPPAPAAQPPETQVAQLPVTRLPAVDRAVVDTALATVPCVQATAEVAGEGRVELAGTAASPELAAEVRQAVETVQGVQAVAGQLDVVAAPGCVAAAKADRAVANPPGAAPEIQLNSADGVYRDGEFMVLTLTMPEQRGGYLYVDLLTDAGDAYHLLPEPLTAANQLPAGGSIKLGVEEAERRAGVRNWQVSPPFGPGYVVAVASERPLYDGLRKIEEPLQAYLDVLLPALADPALGAKAVNVERLEFRKRD